jgi:hypothetical protein
MTIETKEIISRFDRPQWIPWVFDKAGVGLRERRKYIRVRLFFEK